MSAEPNPNKLFDDLQGQLTSDDVDRIKGLLHNTPLSPNDLERCGTSFTAICRELVKKNTIKPDILDFSFLEKLFENMGLLVLKDMVSNFVATAKSSRDAKKRGSSRGNPQSPGGAKSTGSSTQTRSKTNRAHTQKRKGSKTSHGHQRSAKRSKSKDQPTEGTSGCSGNSGTGSNPQSSGGPHSKSSSKQKGGITGIGNSPVFNAKKVVIKQTFQSSDQAVKNEKGKDDGDADPQEQESSDGDD